jgi:hypothetical protein
MTGRGATRAEIFPAQPGLKSARKCADGIRMNIAHAAALTCALAAAPAPAGEAVHVVGSRQLRIAVVDPFGSERVPREVLARLAAAFSGAQQGIPLHGETITARVAAARVAAGECDAVLIVGPSRPAPLRRLEAPTIAGGFGPSYMAMPLYLVLATEEPTLRLLLEQHFMAVLSASEQDGRRPMVAAR